MDEQKILPLILNKRAAKILQYQVIRCYQVEESNVNILRCAMPVGKDRYVDLSTGKEINALSIQVVADEAGHEDTLSLVGKQEPVKAGGDLLVEKGIEDIANVIIRRRKKAHSLPVEKQSLSKEAVRRVKKSK